MAFKTDDITGEQRAHLTAISCVGRRKVDAGRERYVWLWKCDCGGVREAAISKVRSGQITHCGCMSKRMKRRQHGQAVHGAVTPTYATYQGAKSRCMNKKNKRYAAYGGRGIYMCARWLSSFQNFLEDMGERPEGMSLERLDVNGPYSPENCTWATRQEQSENTRSTVRIRHNGAEMSLKSFAACVGVNYKALHFRVRRSGQDPHAAARAMLQAPYTRIARS